MRTGRTVWFRLPAAQTSFKLCPSPKQNVRFYSYFYALCKLMVAMDSFLLNYFGTGVFSLNRNIRTLSLVFYTPANNVNEYSRACYQLNNNIKFEQYNQNHCSSNQKVATTRLWTMSCQQKLKAIWLENAEDYL